MSDDEREVLEQARKDADTDRLWLAEADRSTNPHNKMVLQVYAAIAETCLNAKRKAVAP